MDSGRRSVRGRTLLPGRTSIDGTQRNQRTVVTHYKDKGMTDPVPVLIERVDGDEVFAQLEREKVGRRWQIDTFAEGATVVVRLNLQLGG